MRHFSEKYTTIDQYDSISELYNWLKNTKTRSSARNSSSRTDNTTWCGTETIQQAYDLLLGGDDQLYKDFIKMRDINFDKKLSSLVSIKRPINDVVGFQVNVPNYLLGVPKCMVNREKTTQKVKVLNIFLNMTVSAGVSSNTIKNIGTKYLQVIEYLEKYGYRCNLYVGIDATSCGDNLICMTRIKTDKEPLNIKKCVFPMVHPSMFRRIMFEWLEKCEIKSGNEITNDGYGCPETSQERVKNRLKDKTRKDYIVWGFQNCNYDKVGTEAILKELEEKYGIKVGVK